MDLFANTLGSVVGRGSAGNDGVRENLDCAHQVPVLRNPCTPVKLKSFSAKWTLSKTTELRSLFKDFVERIHHCRLRSQHERAWRVWIAASYGGRISPQVCQNFGSWADVLGGGGGCFFADGRSDRVILDRYFV